jgi:acetyl-CoA carboxylase carboxyltransferase component
MHDQDELRRRTAAAQAGGAPKYHAKNAEEGKLFCRDRLKLFFDDGG